MKTYGGGGAAGKRIVAGNTSVSNTRLGTALAVNMSRPNRKDPASAHVHGVPCMYAPGSQTPWQLNDGHFPVPFI